VGLPRSVRQRNFSVGTIVWRLGGPLLKLWVCCGASGNGISSWGPWFGEAFRLCAEMKRWLESPKTWAARCWGQLGYSCLADSDRLPFRARLRVYPGRLLLQHWGLFPVRVFQHPALQGAGFSANSGVGPHVLGHVGRLLAGHGQVALCDFEGAVIRSRRFTPFAECRGPREWMQGGFMCLSIMVRLGRKLPIPLMLGVSHGETVHLWSNDRSFPRERASEPQADPIKSAGAPLR